MSSLLVVEKLRESLLLLAPPVVTGRHYTDLRTAELRAQPTVTLGFKIFKERRERVREQQPLVHEVSPGFSCTS
ncbi:hypothetical protein EYF80_063999 [Liparis tanakae]|uniref:Uncharacterized protein n=1 Tax=Liparis tanakae TaxID=230148 RepID=A0A4Z2EAM1_9TELE|nr:hypothetical protein EYF80_063999 [Liparis tanakae]